MADTRGRMAVKLVDPTTNANEAGITASGELKVSLTASSATVTVDSELPAAAALADATANPTIPSVGSLLLGYNGTTWDRLQVDASKFLKVNVAAGSLTVDSEFPAAATLADNTTNPSTTTVADMLHVFDGTTWDRARSTDAFDGNAALTTVGAPVVGIGPGFSRRFNPANLGTAGNSASTVDTNGAGVAGIQVGTTTTGTWTIEATNNGTDWYAPAAIDVATGANVQTSNLTPTQGKQYNVNVAGARQLRLRTVTTLGVTMAHVITLGISENLAISGNQNVNIAASGATVTVDSELPAAAALADATANPTTPLVGAALEGYNGTTWDRLQVDGSKFLKVTLAAAPATVTVDSELPAAATLADATTNPSTTSVGSLLLGYNGTTWDRLQVDGSKFLKVNIAASSTVTVDTELPAAAALADATANPTVPGVGGFLLGYNGSTWDRVRTANTGRLQVDVINGGGSDAPTSPQTKRATSSALAAGSTATLQATQVTSGKTGKLERVMCSSSVPIKVDLQTVLNGSGTTVATWFVPANSAYTFETRHRNYIQQAESATAGYDGFQVIITNNDNNSAADQYAFFAWDEV